MSNTRAGISKTLGKSWVEWQADHPIYWELIPALLRLFLAFLGPIVVAFIGILLFEPVRPWDQAIMLHQEFPYAILPIWLDFLLVPFTKWENFRYLIPPAGTIIFIILAGARYVQDIYDLKFYKSSFHYLISSMFGLFYPRLRIEGGKKQISEGEENTIDAIGGPGWAAIQPGNSVVFRNLRGPSRASISRPYFMKPFERITYIASLDDQHGHVDTVPTITQDGIQVVIRDIHFRFRILPEDKSGHHVFRSPDRPYPFDEKALKDMVYNLTVDENDLDQWQTAVKRVVVGSITDYINSHNIDFLTAPRQKDQAPRVDLRSEAFTPNIHKQLSKYGAELIWIDVGHIDIKDDAVDQQRLDYWSSGKVGNANVIRAYGDAMRLKYQELGRAQCQAELIMSITDSLQDVSLGKDPVQNSRKILMARTAEILDAINRQKQNDRGEL